MPKMNRLIAPKAQWQLAVVVMHPRPMAGVFAGFIGQFYDRADFDALARRTWRLYAELSPAAAWHFRAELDERLYRRYQEPVIWEADARHPRGQGPRRGQEPRRRGHRADRRVARRR
jgi:hypothetical protein